MGQLVYVMPDLGKSGHTMLKKHILVGEFTNVLVSKREKNVSIKYVIRLNEKVAGKKLCCMFDYLIFR